MNGKVGLRQNPRSHRSFKLYLFFFPVFMKLWLRRSYHVHMLTRIGLKIYFWHKMIYSWYLFSPPRQTNGIWLIWNKFPYHWEYWLKGRQ